MIWNLIKIQNIHIQELNRILLGLESIKLKIHLNKIKIKVFVGINQKFLD